MPRISLAGFADPVRRPRYIIWALVGLLAFAAVMVVALGVTSTRWFCSEGCHKVQDDTILAYERSSHANVSCMACHMPVNADPLTFMLHKAEALGELYLTVTNQYELPLNGESEVGLTMPAEQCTQCHDLNLRDVTPTRGVLIDHKAHEKAGVSCAICHNRVAHREDFTPTLKDPATGKPNVVHADFMSMEACFRCHTHEAKSAGLKAPGACTACHPADFDLKPASHREPGFFPAGHAELAKQESEGEGEASAETSGTSEGASGERVSAKAASGEEAEAGLGEAGLGEAVRGEGIGPGLPKVDEIRSCSTCHAKTFCSDCHGLEMPHPKTFSPKAPGANKAEHGRLGKQSPKVCAKCHGSANRFCDECHHGVELEWEYVSSEAWLRQHPKAVASTGAQACFDCHRPTYCAQCHVRGPKAVR